MASGKDFKKKIRSISNTRKITRTMELVATAKSKRTQNRIQASAPYHKALLELLESLARAGAASHPLLEGPETFERTAVLVVTANRGLCGGYNTNVLDLAQRTILEEEREGRKVDVYMAGRKGISKFRHLGIPTVERFINLDDKASFADVEKVAEGWMDRFRKGEIGKAVAVYTQYFSAAVHKPGLAQILPILPPNRTAGKRAPEGAVDFIFEPDPASILDALLPYSLKAVLFRIILESSASEQVARRLAMKLATDNAEEMIRFYTSSYNRSRQAGITQQLNEIVSGANALE